MSDPTRLLVVTDLDATLLDEHYHYDPARPALDALRRDGHPVVLASSKTLAEMTELAGRLGLGTPIIAENGGVIAWPGHDRSIVQTPGLDRATLLRHAHAWREAHQARFHGFADWSDAEVARLTGLDVDAAARARDRHATEPILWEDSDDLREAFAQAMATHGIRLLRGGRFLHLMGDADKADGLRVVRDRLTADSPEARWITVALGDSPNDVRMLEAADVAVVVHNPRHPTPLSVRAPRIVRTTEPGPAGWRDAITTLLDDLEGEQDG